MFFGHEFMGIVESNIASKNSSACNNTNPSKEMEALIGHRCTGYFSYSHLTGGQQGGQAQLTRVPFADIKLLPVPDSVKDEQVVMLSDIACTAWHGMELGEIKEGQTVGL